MVENVNFTHLLEPEEVDPSQELLQKMSHFLVIFVSSEAERQFILSAPNRFKVNEHTICCISTEKHLALWSLERLDCRGMENHSATSGQQSSVRFLRADSKRSSVR